MTDNTCRCETDKTSVDLALLEPVLSRHESDPGALIPVLQEAQAVYGYLPKEAMIEIAERRGETLPTVFGVATFYTQFHLSPRGRNIIRVCTGTACHVGGANEIVRAMVDELNVELGATSDDLRFTVEAVACVGCCGIAPVAVVNDKPHGKLDSTRARKLAKQIMRTAQ